MAGGQPQEDPEQAARDTQRGRLISAVARAAAEHGYAKFTVDRAVRQAGVSSATFYEHFSSEEQALLAAYEAFLDRLSLEVAGVCEGGDPWPVKVRAAVGAVLSFMTEASNMARMFAVEAAAASLAVTERQFVALEHFATLLRGGRELYPRASSLPAPTERALVGGIASIVAAHLLAEDPQALAGLEPELVELVLTPYVGAAEAKLVAAA